jgi:hypothetical protein
MSALDRVTRVTVTSFLVSVIVLYLFVYATSRTITAPPSTAPSTAPQLTPVGPYVWSRSSPASGLSCWIVESQLQGHPIAVYCERLKEDD